MNHISCKNFLLGKSNYKATLINNIMTKVFSSWISMKVHRKKVFNYVKFTETDFKNSTSNSRDDDRREIIFPKFFRFGDL